MIDRNCANILIDSIAVLINLNCILTVGSLFAKFFVNRLERYIAVFVKPVLN